MSEITGYELSRDWFDWCFENPELISPNHAALYFFAIEHCNRMGWKQKFSLPTTMAKDAIGIRNYKTYSNTLSDLIDWGFIKMIQKSTNQYSANIIALVKNTKAHTKALSKASLKHVPKHVPKQVQSIDSIYKPRTKELKNIEPKNGVVAKMPRPEYQLSIDFWLNEFHIDWNFSGQHGKALKSLLSKIEKKMKEGGREISPQSIFESFKYVCQHLPEWFKDKDLSVIDSKFNEITEELKNGKSNSENKRFGKSTVAEVERVRMASLNFPTAEEIRNADKGFFGKDE